jgi:hypothetical protein
VGFSYIPVLEKVSSTVVQEMVSSIVSLEQDPQSVGFALVLDLALGQTAEGGAGHHPDNHSHIHRNVNANDHLNVLQIVLLEMNHSVHQHRIQRHRLQKLLARCQVVPCQSPKLPSQLHTSTRLHLFLQTSLRRSTTIEKLASMQIQ